MALKRTAAPSPLITFAEMARHLRLDGDGTEQALVESYIAAATDYLDGWSGILGRALGEQTWDLVLDRFPGGAIRIPLGPLVSVSSVKYFDENGDEQTVAADNYAVDTVSMPGWVVPLANFSWPSTLDAINAVSVRFVAGHASVPTPILQWIRLRVAAWFQNREALGSSTVVELPGAAQLIAPYRSTFIG